MPTENLTSHNFNSVGICRRCGLSLAGVGAHDDPPSCQDHARQAANAFVAEDAANRIVMRYLRVTFITPRIVAGGRLCYPQCEAERTGSYANDVGPRPQTPDQLRDSGYRCQSSAKVDYAGQRLCIRHAQARALKYVMEPYEIKETK